MKYDDLAFVNQQLSTLLRQGVPLEGGLLRVCEEMKRGVLRDELAALEKDLSMGASLDDALSKRKLPAFYAQMLRIGVQSGDLVGVLVLLTDYYQRANNLWTRFKGLMLYPVLVLTAAVILSCVLAFSSLTMDLVADDSVGFAFKSQWVVGSFIPPLFFSLLLFCILAVMAVPALRRMLRWRLSPFKEAALSQAGSTLGLMLKKGCQLKEALSLLQQLEKGTIAEGEIALWQKHLSEGNGKLSQFASPGRAFTPLFLWLASNAGEDLATGFQRAGDVYYERALRRAEILLYSVLPVSTLLLGAMIVAQLFPLLHHVRQMLDVLGSFN